MAVDYYAYLASREWGLLKEQVRQRSGGQCERCHKGRHEATHHLTYEHVGEERLEELLGVCKPCHEWLGGHSDYDPIGESDLESYDSAVSLSLSKPEYEVDERGRIIGHEPPEGWRRLTPEQIVEDWEWFRDRYPAEVEERMA